MEAYEYLEGEWAAWNDLDPAGMVATASGTAALHLAAEALHLPPGSEVVTSDFNMIAVPRAITLAGHVPVFVDCSSDLLMDMDLFNSELGEERIPTAALIVHIYGRRCDMNAITLAAAWEHFKVIEDLAEAHGVRPHPATDAACWSFYRNKVIHGEEGGAVWFRNPDHAALARELRSLGFTAAHNFLHTPRGHNYRMSNAHARLILDSLTVADDSLRARRQIEGLYDRHCPAEWRMPPRDVVWVYDVRLPGIGHAMQTRVVRALQAVGIQARHGFRPMHEQEEYRHCRRVGGEVAERAGCEVIYLPCDPGTVDEETARMAFDVIREEVGR